MCIIETFIIIIVISRDNYYLKCIASLYLDMIVDPAFFLLSHSDEPDNVSTNIRLYMRYNLQ